MKCLISHLYLIHLWCSFYFLIVLTLSIISLITITFLKEDCWCNYIRKKWFIAYLYLMFSYYLIHYFKVKVMAKLMVMVMAMVIIKVVVIPMVMVMDYFIIMVMNFWLILVRFPWCYAITFCRFHRLLLFFNTSKSQIKHRQEHN